MRLFELPNKCEVCEKQNYIFLEEIKLSLIKIIAFKIKSGFKKEVRKI